MSYSASQVREVRAAMTKQEGRDVTQQHMADLLKVSRRTIIRWEQRGIPWNCSYWKQREFQKLRDSVLK